MVDVHDYALGRLWRTPSQGEASQFFAQLRVASQRARQAWTGSTALSPYGEDAWPRVPWTLLYSAPTDVKGPIGAIIHYTASSEPKGTVRWFCDPALSSRASAHFVVSQAVEWPTGATDGLPLVQALPATVVLCRDITQPAWHATWANAWAVGFELVNQGCETPDTTPRPVAATAAKRVPCWGRLWQPYTPMQSTAVAIIIRYLAALFPEWRPDLVLGHENVQMVQTPEGCGGHDKRDPGPLLDLGTLVRAADPYDLAQTGLMDGAGNIQAANLLSRLRYNVGRRLPRDTQGPAALSTYLDQLRIFQFAAGLVPDAIAGPKTMAALTARIKDREGG